MTEKQKRGFALLSPEKMREVAALGGRVAHATGRAHQFTSAEGQAAGRKRAEQKRLERLARGGIEQDAAGTSTRYVSKRWVCPCGRGNHGNAKRCMRCEKPKEQPATEHPVQGIVNGIAAQVADAFPTPEQAYERAKLTHPMGSMGEDA